MELLLHDDSLAKPMSTMYKELFTVRQKILTKCREVWMQLMPNFQGEVKIVTMNGRYHLGPSFG